MRALSSFTTFIILLLFIGLFFAFTNISATKESSQNIFSNSNNITLFKNLHLSHSQTNADITFVAFTNKGCGACMNFEPMWKEAVSVMANTKYNNKSQSHHHNTLKPHFVWVECSSASEICSSSSILSSSDENTSHHKIRKFPFVAAFLTPSSFRNETDDTTKTNPVFLRIDGVEDGLKPRVNKSTGKAVIPLPKRDAQEDDESQQRWTYERLIDRLDSLLNPVIVSSSSSSSSNQKITKPNDISKFLLQQNENEPSTIIITYFPPTEDASTFSKLRKQTSSSSRMIGAATPCTSVRQEQQLINNKTKTAFYQAASFFSVSQDVQYKFLSIDSNDEQAIVNLMTNQDTIGKRTNFHEVSDDGGEYYYTNNQRSDSNSKENSEENDDDDVLMMTEQEKYLERKLMEALSAEDRLAHFQRKMDKTRKIKIAKKKTREEYDGYRVEIVDAEKSNGVVSSFVAEHLNDRRDTADDTCHFVSRPVMGVLTCVEFEEDHQRHRLRTSSTSSSSPLPKSRGAMSHPHADDKVFIGKTRGRCLRFTAKWQWIPGSAENTEGVTESTSHNFLNYLQRENIKKKLATPSRSHVQALDIISFLITNARPRVSLVTVSESDRFYPGRVFTVSESLSRAARRPFAFEKSDFQGVKRFHDHLHYHQKHHEHLLTENKNGMDETNQDHQDSYHHHHSHHHPTPPIFGAFVETQSCQGRPSSFWPILRALEVLAAEYQNTTFVLFDSLRYSEYYLRSGLTRPVVEKMKLGMIVMDHGRKFSVLDALSKRNWTRDEKLLDYALGRKKIEKNFTSLEIDLDNARLLLQYYWSGMIRPFGRVNRPQEDHIRPSEIISKLRLKTARKVLDFVSGKPMEMFNSTSVHHETKKNTQEQKNNVQQDKSSDDNETNTTNTTHQETVADEVERTVSTTSSSSSPDAEQQTQSHQHNNNNNNNTQHKVRILLVESSFKEISKSLTQTISDLYMQQQLLLTEEGETEEQEQEQEKTTAFDIFVKHSELAIVNGEGRGALPLEHLYPKRRSSSMPFFICVDTTHQSTKTASENDDPLPDTHHLRVSNYYASAPSFLEFDQAEKIHAFRELESDEERMEMLTEWMVEQKCFEKYRK